MHPSQHPWALGAAPYEAGAVIMEVWRSKPLNIAVIRRDICKKFKIPTISTLHRWILPYNGHELESSPGGKGKP